MTFDTVVTTFEQAKVSLEQTLQSAEKIKNTTSQTVQTAISSSIGQWVEQHPMLFWVVNILDWAAHHPIISIVVLLITFAIISSFVKAISRLIETASLSLVQVPLKGIHFLVKISLLSLAKIGNSAVKQVSNSSKSDRLPTLIPEMAQSVHEDRQRRLAEISVRLKEIQQEQDNLLQEAAAILSRTTE
ncbi:hypothetical protein NUACC21_13210 [Scytonema sp. NUACC21]